MKSIITDDMDHCFICKMITKDKNNTRPKEHTHHVFYGTANRKWSDKYKIVIPICHYHHTGSNEALHKNDELDQEIKKIGQKKFEEIYSHEKFMRIFGRNYL